MTEFKLVPPQLVINSRMLYFGWVPEYPDAVKALVPKALQPKDNGAVFMNQYVVDTAEQTSGFGAYSLTYIGADLKDLDAPDGVTPGRWWTHYFNSSESMGAYVKESGVPFSIGETNITLDGDNLIATTFSDSTPIIRTTARVGNTINNIARGQLRYLSALNDTFISGIYPFISETVAPWEILNLEFLEPTHSVYALRPKKPLEIIWGFYSPRASFCYPGGQVTLNVMPYS
ncbi:MAG: hypothetical protein KME29_32950 [Calothrix sp. FI2-JRJ7]|jgi:hypothetical protein|nr:hypothetical protein [Calothrix sp. FI2-JRJ7]